MDSLSRFWAKNAIFLGVWEGLAVKTGVVPTISTTVARAHKRWPLRTLIFLLAWASGLVAYLYTKEPDAEPTPEPPVVYRLKPWPEPSKKRTTGTRG